MSINHFSTDLPDTLWWTPPPPPPPQQRTQIMEPPPQSPLISHLYHHHHQLGKSPLNFNLNQNDDESHSDDRDDRQNDDALVDNNNNNNNKIATELRDSINIMIQKEAMFEKPLTPSDVGKLNRLVIPKQHAEKYFPIGGTGGGGDSVEKGLLLSFEDESGKSWRFRYSYWNSSQSYVLTKGWSRFVKEKRLDAGDVVMFERQVNDNERFFIGWRRRNAVQQTMGEVGGGGWARMVYAGHPYPPPPPHMQQQYTAATAGLGAGGGNMQNQTRGSGNSKTVRLFGVNLECQSDEADGTSQAQAHYHHHSTPLLQNHMDINFSRDVDQMRFHQG